MSKLCPLMKKQCIEHQCAWYTHVTGVHPQTGQPIDHWDCAVVWLPVMLTENARMQRNTAASVDSMRNEVVKRQDQFLDAVALGVNHEVSTPPLLDSDRVRNCGPALDLSTDPSLDSSD